MRGHWGLFYLLITLTSVFAFAGQPSIDDDLPEFVRFHYPTGVVEEVPNPAILNLAEIDQLYALVAQQGRNGTIRPELLLTDSNKVGDLLQGPDEIFAEMAKQIQTVKREILFATFVWEKDSPAARMLRKAFADLQNHIRENRGNYHLPIKLKIVENKISKVVKNLLRYSASANTQKKFSRILEDSGKYGLGFDFDLDPSLIELEFAGFHHITNALNHTKYIVIDNERAVLTGSNVQNRNNLELGLSIQGPVVEALRSDFQELWNASDFLNTNRAKGPLEKTELTSFSRIENPTGTEKILVLTRKAEMNLLGRSNQNPQNQALLSLFHSAKKSIRILTPNLNFRHCTRILIEALQRGVHVQIILSRNFNQKLEQTKYFQGGTNDEIASKLLKKYKKLFEESKSNPPGKLEIRWYAHQDGIVSGGPSHTSHAKYLAIDDEITVIGSTNMDTQSWYASRELSFLIPNPYKTRKWIRELFIPILKRSEIVNY